MRRKAASFTGIFSIDTFRSTKPSLSLCISFTKSKKATSTSMIRQCSLKIMVSFSADFAVSTKCQKIKEPRKDRQSHKHSQKQGKI